MFKPIEITPVGLEKLFFIAVFIIGMVIFAYEAYYYIRLLKKFAPENRTDFIGQRIGRLFKFVFAQRRLLDQFLMGVAHFLIFWGFCYRIIRDPEFFRQRVIVRF